MPSASHSSSQPPQPPTSYLRPHPPPSAAASASTSNASSTSLAASNAEGKPIPVDDSTAQHRTSALREFNHNFPSRHRYAKSTGAQSSTYSQPVIVRSYYSPLPSRPTGSDQGVVIVSRGGSRAISDTGGPAAALVRRVLPFTTGLTPTRNGVLGAMARTRNKKRLDGPEEAKLPPIDAFRFKSFMAHIEDEGSNDINADLDRIAEICAKSRYSLSNQYEVHYAPHGSGTSFMASGDQAQDSQGPTLQAISSDDERNIKRRGRRPIGVRRNSRAMGTLETIMSSSRSSDEDRSKKKSAADIAEEVRGRAAKKGSRHGSSKSSQSDPEENQTIEEDSPPRFPRTRRSGSLALIDGTRMSLILTDTNAPQNIGLLSEPAQPQTSSSQLEIRTGYEQLHKERRTKRTKTKVATSEGSTQPLVHGSISPVDPPYHRNSIMSTLSDWMHWRAADSSPMPQGRAEGSLRELLRSTDVKGKGIETAAYP
ncbi:hypothetical protein B0T10DRAFT_457985 [Thelonectria olida]|uniref:Uncharacterized protein n=1 Tax=Thelonectria olida TaxID=1576542 RepID=A0A9P9AU61_9HYPO|nr:hypothetical protein B0T10DRAFT_457985 [Thelonectria olida]